MPTITRLKNMEDVWGRTRVQGITLTGDSSSYNEQSPTGLGYPIYAAPLGFKLIYGAKVIGCSGTIADSGGLLAVIDTVTLALTLGICVRFFYPTADTDSPPAMGTEVPNGTNLSTVAIKLELTGV